MSLKLPDADEFGNRWFGPPGRRCASEFPAIIHHSKGGYIVSLGVRGMLWTGNELRKFKYPVKALAALNRALEA